MASYWGLLIMTVTILIILTILIMVLIALSRLPLLFGEVMIRVPDLSNLAIQPLDGGPWSADIDTSSMAFFLRGVQGLGGYRISGVQVTPSNALFFRDRLRSMCRSGANNSRHAG